MERTHTLIVGGGPAGVAVLSAADKNGRLGELAGAGLMMVERTDRIGDGLIGRYTINSDSTAETFLTAVNQSRVPVLRAMEDHPVVQMIADHIGDLGVPLPKSAVFLRLMGEQLAGYVQENGGSVLTGHEVLHAQQLSSETWRTRLRRLADGQERDVLSQAVVIATGGHQPETLIGEKQVAGVPVAERYASKLLRSDVFLATQGLQAAREILGGKKAPRIVVLGGSTSALAALNKLLRTDSGFDLAPGSLTLLHREPLRPFYPSIEAAHAEGFTDFGADDICPVSGFVYRLAGFRLEARALVMKLLRIGDAEAEPRVATHRITGDDDVEAVRLMDEADLVIAALGYLPHALTLLDRDGAPLRIAAGLPHHPRMVDGACRVVGANGEPVPGLYGIGLAAGFVPHGKLGGERSFRGQANGLWLWQNDVGQLIVDQILSAIRPERAVA
jgi:cation diffusion facilitator CzcD-associated flavoprotein CzcO